jgi:predicted small secreted protein
MKKSFVILVLIIALISAAVTIKDIQRDNVRMVKVLRELNAVNTVIGAAYLQCNEEMYEMTIKHNHQLTCGKE